MITAISILDTLMYSHLIGKATGPQLNPYIMVVQGNRLVFANFMQWFNIKGVVHIMGETCPT